jgi:hypothetical protein
MNKAFLPRSYRIFTAVLVAAICTGFSLAAAGQSSAPAGTPIGPGGVHAASGNNAAPSLAPAAPKAIAASEEAAQKPAPGINQGVKMHGHWIIDIKNPDGTLAQHHEFENSIQYDGQNYLVGLLSGYASPGAMGIYFTAPTNGTAPCAATYNFCAIVTSLTTAPAVNLCGNYYCATGLTITPTFGVGPTLKLAGSITANEAGTIGTVGTTMNGCGQTGVAFGAYPTAMSTVSPATCFTSTVSGAGGGNDFGGTMTSTSISPISVANGQIIQVTVTLSFS